MMEAIGYQGIGSADVLTMQEVAHSETGPRDLIDAVKGISVNPVDVKLRAAGGLASFVILGFDADGVVVATGADVTGHAVGDEVFYAGDMTRAGTNAEFHLVNESITGHRPANLGFFEAASMPLTSITAGEMLFDSFRLTEGGGQGQSLLATGGAGGVGSIMIQLAKRLTGLTVITTASRPETQDWVRRMGADHVIDHRGDMVALLRDLGLSPTYVAGPTATDQHWLTIVELIAPRGYIELIDDPQTLEITLSRVRTHS